MRTVIVSVLTFLVATTGFSASVTNAMYGGSYSGWANSWTALSGLNDPNDGVKGRLDFVGDATNPGAYVASDSSYLYFRIRVKATGDEVRADEWQDSIWIMVDDMGRGVTNRPDYAFAWDTKGRWSDNPLVPNAEHGLELQTNQTSGASWNNIVMNDVDGNVAKKTGAARLQHHRQWVHPYNRQSNNNRFRANHLC